MHGFVKMESKKLFGADRYVMFDQIARVEKDGVHLTVDDSEGLLKGLVDGRDREPQCSASISGNNRKFST
jgi:hypothetical protein